MDFLIAIGLAAPIGVLGYLAVRYRKRLIPWFQNPPERSRRLLAKAAYCNLALAAAIAVLLAASFPFDKLLLFGDAPRSVKMVVALTLMLIPPLQAVSCLAVLASSKQARHGRMLRVLAVTLVLALLSIGLLWALAFKWHMSSIG